MLISGSAASWLRQFGFRVLDFFLPRLCLFCGGVVAEEAKAAVCPDCEGKIEWVESPVCPCCGLMFPVREGEDRLCGSCQTEPPPFARARAAAVYEGPVAKAVTRFKFGRQMAYLPVMQHWLQVPRCAELAADADLLVPVPLHPRRVQSRGFNQALLLARAFPEAEVGRETLARVRYTVPQVGLNPKERRDNVRRAFAVPRPEEVQNKKILLVDDLYTTGATVRECARVLRRAGARRVEVLTVARVKHE
ncbi:MAG: ComF family protein [Deltaproteobacteria bacterium]|nr:ComF family protein [Deltaproteobacteria bacterium]MBI4796896.1 ComF family protein [Deltaproteobacteria bacterium]